VDDTIQGGDTRIKLNFLGMNLRGALDKRRRKGRRRSWKGRHSHQSLSRERRLKKVVTFLMKKTGWHHQLPPRVTPALVTPLQSTPR